MLQPSQFPKIRRECFLRANCGWEPPSGQEIRSLLSHYGVSNGIEAARIIGITATDASAKRIMGRYGSGERPIGYKAWRLLLLELHLYYVFCGDPMQHPRRQS